MNQTSGLPGNKGSKFVRMNTNSRNQDHHDVVLSKKQQQTAVLGLLTYIVIFIVLVPLLLHYFGFKELLKLYFVNTDLIAITISFNKGGFKDIFKYLYNDTGPLIGYLSQIIINWSVLLGLFYIALSESKKHSTTKILSKISVILLATYLLPGRFIIKLMESINNLLLQTKLAKSTSNTFIGNLTILLGLLLVVFTITMEGLGIKYLSPQIKKIYDLFL